MDNDASREIVIKTIFSVICIHLVISSTYRLHQSIETVIELIIKCTDAQARQRSVIITSCTVVIVICCHMKYKPES